MIEGLAFILLPYATIRILSYVFNSRPYLWWHGLADLGMVILFIIAITLIQRNLDKRYLMMNTKKIRAWMKQHLDEVHDPKTDEYNCTLLTELAATEFDIEDTEQLEDMSFIAFDVVSEETMDEQEIYRR